MRGLNPKPNLLISWWHGGRHYLRAEAYKLVAEERAARIEELEAAALEADCTRRALHNQIQELRRNVRVFCRVRPTTSDTACVECPSDGKGA